MSGNRTLTITVLALALLAVVAASVAVTLWLVRGDARSQVVGGAPGPGTPEPTAPSGGGGAKQTLATPQVASSASSEKPGATEQSTGIFINERDLTAEQARQLVQTYGAPPPQGHFWYDSRSGLYGLWGREAAGFIRPGHNFGPLPANASGGNTGVFINGREINMTEAVYCQRIFGAVYRGRWWLDGATGYLGVEGNPMPVANLWVALQQAQRSAPGGDNWYGWRDGRGSVLSSSGNCTIMSVPGANVYGSSGCN